ncbi:TPA: PIN domain-containing protein [Burkholderia vietnamiensis]|nr:PIN domain-containing protein [Burkholderia vietnamiensis]
MAVNLTIAAEVVDITRDRPQPNDVFFVDTNVWYWLTYSKASACGARHYQVTSYPNYTNNALSAGSTIYQSGLSLAELTHLIEKSERDIYQLANSALQITAKEYRHNYPNERANVSSEIQVACSQVASLGSPLSITIDGPTSSACLARVPTEAVDGYDLFILESMRANGITQVITDDGDFATIPGIRVFTANRNVVQTARAQNRLIVR